MRTMYSKFNLKALVNKKGSASLTMTVMFTVLFVNMLLFVYSYFRYSESCVVLKTRSDAIADGAAVYADTGTFTDDTIDSILKGEADATEAKTIIDSDAASEMKKILLAANNKILENTGLKIKMDDNSSGTLSTKINGTVYSGELSTNFRYFISHSEINSPSIFSDDDKKFNTDNTIYIVNKEGYLSTVEYSTDERFYPADYNEPCIPVVKSYITTLTGDEYVYSTIDYTTDLYKSILNQFNVKSDRYTNAIAAQKGSTTLAERVLLWDLLGSFGYSSFPIKETGTFTSVEKIYTTILNNCGEKESLWTQTPNPVVAQNNANLGQLTIAIYKGHIYPISPVYAVVGDNDSSVLSVVGFNDKNTIDISGAGNWSKRGELSYHDTKYSINNCYLFSFNSKYL